MSSTNVIDLSQLPAPDVIEQLDYEIILAEMLADHQARMAAAGEEFTALVESDPAYKLLETVAYREMLLRQRVNNAAHAVMLAYGESADLDQIGGNYGVERLVIEEGDQEANPPIDATYESDSAYRARIVLSIQGYTTAGSIGSYTFHALSADGDVLDVSINSLDYGVVNVAVLSRTGNGEAPQATLDAVAAALNAEVVRPLCDTVDVQSAEIIEYTIEAGLVLYDGAGSEQVLQAAQAAAEAYAAKMRRLGHDITLSGVYAALHQSGVQKVTLTSPAADIAIEWNQAAYCTAITITIDGTGE